jgi:hypothetical protein
MANGQWKQLLLRAMPALSGGCFGGAIGGMSGDLMYNHGWPRAIGWLIMGMAVGVAEGVYERSPRKLRNGLIGGGIGGLLGGVLFDPVMRLAATESGMLSRATGFIILGIAIGAFVGLTQIVLKEAWLTVLDGYRAGRQLILSQPVTFLGRAEHLPLPFLGPMNKDVEPQHVKISRRPNGSYALEDNNTRLGTRLNNEPVQGPMVLKNGDVIKFGTNFVQFNERRRNPGGEAPAAGSGPSFKSAGAPPPRRVDRKTAELAKTVPPSSTAVEEPPATSADAPRGAFYLVPDPSAQPAGGSPTAVPASKPTQPQPPRKPAAPPQSGQPGRIAAPPPPRRSKS